MTKKKFREHCDLNHVYGRGAKRINAIYFDWQDFTYEEIESGKKTRGFKFAVASSVENGTKEELFNHFYDWVCNAVNLSYWIYSKVAKDDTQRFKTPITFNYSFWG